MQKDHVVQLFTFDIDNIVDRKKINIKKSRNLRFELQIIDRYISVDNKERVHASVPQFMKDDPFGRVSNLKKSAKR